MSKHYFLFLVIVLVTGWCCMPAKAADERYIFLDQIQPEMDGYCLTVWQGTTVEKFPIKVISILRNQRPDARDMILVKVLDERFEKAGAIQGCSGSPVFIQERLAGALAAGWQGCLEPLYLVRPIEQMLQIGTKQTQESASISKQNISKTSYNLFDLLQDSQTAWDALHTDATRMPLPLVCSLPESAVQNWIKPLEKVGLKLMCLASTAQALPATEQADKSTQPAVAGGVLGAVLCYGDVQLAAIGTATQVQDNAVLAFGHSFLGAGAIQLPMAGGFVHSVVPTREASFKLATASQIIGTLRFDQSAGVLGYLGQQPPTIPLQLTVNRPNDAPRVWRCHIAVDRILTPLIAQLVVGSATLSAAGLPPEHTVRYRCRIETSHPTAIEFENVSSGKQLNEMNSEIFNSVMLALNNPFQPLDIRAIAVQVDIADDSRVGAFWSMQIEPNVVKAGKTLTAYLTVQAFRKPKTTYQMEVSIPADLPAGKYTLQVMGNEAYVGFLRQNAPWQFRVENIPTLVEALNRLLNWPRQRLYAVITLPAGGVSWRQHTLPDLPATKAALMLDAKRIEPLEIKKNWLLQTLESDWVIAESAQIDFTVEQPE